MDAHEFEMMPPAHAKDDPAGAGCCYSSATAILWHRNNVGALTIKTQAVAFCGCNHESEFKASPYRGAIILPEASGYVCISPLLA